MKTNEMISLIESGSLDERLLDIYLDEDALSCQRDRYISAVNEFESLYGSKDISIYSAPGRTEVCGNHTDHQHGCVLAASINDDAIAIASKSDSDLVNIMSKGYPMITISLSDIEKNDDEEGTTLSLIKGILKNCLDRGYKIGAFDAYITSDVLGGSGLSSSAAFETLIGNIISGMFNDGAIDAVKIAMIGQYAENVYFGKPCGLMDQMACSVGSLCYIDFKDPSDPVIEKIELDLDKYGYSLCITDTKGSHADLTPDYAAVPAEMKSVAEFFGKDVLRNLDEGEFTDSISGIRDKLGDRAVLRAIHFYDECRRVMSAVKAISDDDFSAFLKEINASGLSSFRFLQNVYTNHDIEHQNVSIALAVSEQVLGSEGGVARVHGGGFAGTIQAFVKNEYVENYRSALDKVFGEGSCAVLKIRKYGGIKVV